MTTAVAGAPYRHLWLVLALLIPATLLAFAKSYFDGVTLSGLPTSTIIHVHAASMSLWFLMLIGQAWFVRTGRYAMHRLVGRSSFVIAPLAMILTSIASHATLTAKPEITPFDARIQIFDVVQITAFTLCWALGIVYRRNTPIHVRYMVSTVLAMGSVLLFRILLGYFAWIPGFASADGVPNFDNVAIANGSILFVLVLALIALDWRRGIRCSPFWVVASSNAVLHIGLFTFAKSEWWMSWVMWFASL